MDCRLRVSVIKLCKICSKWPIRELFILRLQHWCFYKKFYWWNCNSGAWRNCQAEQNYGIVLAECIHMQVSSAGVCTEHVNDWLESVRTDHCQTFHRGRRMLVVILIVIITCYLFTPFIILQIHKGVSQVIFMNFFSTTILYDTTSSTHC